MKLFGLFGRNKKRTVLIVQCRLSSTRLPRKALLPLGGKSVLEWVLASMKKVPADKYYLAVDEESRIELEGIAKNCGWDFFAGSQKDVLDRFCKVIELSKADVVIRATADNPFLFYEAATLLEKEYEAREASGTVDYITFTGLPHGSGVELFNAHSLLKAAQETDAPYDHEHVGPALYNHTEHFNCQFIKAPKEFRFPTLRTTIDTALDYRRAQAVVFALSGQKKVKEPYTAQEILSALSDPHISHSILFVSSTEKGRGTGHLHRCLDLAIKTVGDIFIPENPGLAECASLVAEAKENGLQDFQIIHTLENTAEYDIVVTDLFISPPEIIKALADSSVVALDEGALDTNYADYLLDIIPSDGCTRRANLVESGFISLPKRVRTADECSAQIHTALVVLGGEDPASLSLPAAIALSQCGIYVTVISSRDRESQYAELPEEAKTYIKIIAPVADLKEKLADYDLIVTHYGFTAFEAAACGCSVILLSTSELHARLAKANHFVCLGAAELTKETLQSLLENPANLQKKRTDGEEKQLHTFITELSKGKRLPCPVCQNQHGEKDLLVYRIAERTFRRCRKCGMLYMSWTMQAEETQYNHDYFFGDYERQYGKTYLEDFASIKAQGVRRTSIIDMLYRRNHSSVTPTVLDIGCAMGPFLDAASDAGWQVFGTDVSKDAVQYVSETLHFPALCASFPAVDVTGEFGIDKFDAVTMWYVIEHFKNVDEVLKAVSALIKTGGIFAFSTPSASGVSGRYNTQKFFEESPADHYTLWEVKRAAGILRRYGFKVVKIVSTGIHPERFPLAQKKGYKEKSVQMRFLKAVSRLFKWGDTFEVYCKKVR